jgi:hypothetical protein
MYIGDNPRCLDEFLAHDDSYLNGPDKLRLHFTSPFKSEKFSIRLLDDSAFEVHRETVATPEDNAVFSSVGSSYTCDLGNIAPRDLGSNQREEFLNSLERVIRFLRLATETPGLDIQRQRTSFGVLSAICNGQFHETAIEETRISRAACLSRLADMTKKVC